MGETAALDYINTQLPGVQVKVALILGSGLGHLTDTLDGTAIDYSKLAGFPKTGVSGHNPKLVIGELEGVNVAILGGRAHYYEHGNANVMRLPLEVLKGLGAELLVLTNAAGSLREDIPPGDIMLIKDHMNLAGDNPLIGEQDDARFVNMVDAYDPPTREALQAASRAEGIALKEGVYAWHSGPSFETPAEVNASRILGADAVGMSTVPEVILARFLEMKCAAISTITNLGAGMGEDDLSHEQTKAIAPIGAQKLERVLRRFLKDLAV
ncbi:MAG: purine-nucleoside phosphorylase [Hyphomicrobiales bacterium]